MFSLPPPPKSLIITADDFGFGVPTSRGIIRAHKAGVVTATSLMVVTEEHASDSVQLLSDAPNLEVGLHLVLSGAPQRALVARGSSGLIRRTGTFHSLKGLIFQACLGRLDRTAVFDEICAQADRCRKLLGRPPAYVDGHHHAHQLPIVRDALIDAMKAGALPKISRLTVESPGIRLNVHGSSLRRLIMQRIGAEARQPFLAAAIKTNDSIFGMISPAQLSQENPWAAYLPYLPNQGVTEWFVHPGELDESLIGRDTYLAERARELEFFERLGSHPNWPQWKSVLTTKSRL